MSEEAMLTLMAENRKLRAEIAALAAAIPLAEKNGEQRAVEGIVRSCVGYAGAIAKVNPNASDVLMSFAGLIERGEWKEEP